MLSDIKLFLENCRFSSKASFATHFHKIQSSTHTNTHTEVELPNTAKWNPHSQHYSVFFSLIHCIHVHLCLFIQKKFNLCLFHWFLYSFYCLLCIKHFVTLVLNTATQINFIIITSRLSHIERHFTCDKLVNMLKHCCENNNFTCEMSSKW